MHGVERQKERGQQAQTAPAQPCPQPPEERHRRDSPGNAEQARDQIEGRRIAGEQGLQRGRLIEPAGRMPDGIDETVDQRQRVDDRGAGMPKPVRIEIAADHHLHGWVDEGVFAVTAEHVGQAKPETVETHPERQAQHKQQRA